MEREKGGLSSSDDKQGYSARASKQQPRDCAWWSLGSLARESASAGHARRKGHQNAEASQAAHLEARDGSWDEDSAWTAAEWLEVKKMRLKMKMKLKLSTSSSDGREAKAASQSQSQRSLRQVKQVNQVNQHKTTASTSHSQHLWTTQNAIRFRIGLNPALPFSHAARLTVECREERRLRLIHCRNTDKHEIGYGMPN